MLALVARASCFVLLSLGSLLLPRLAQADCDVIPQTSTVFRGALGSLDRPYAQPGDQLTLSVETAGCDPESAGLVGQAPLASTYFDATLEGWTAPGGSLLHNGSAAAGTVINPGVPAGAIYGVAPAAYGLDWSTATGIRWSHKLLMTESNPPVLGLTATARISGPGGSAEFRENLSGYPQNVWTPHVAPLDEASWTLTSGTWAALIANVTSLQLWGEPGFPLFDFEVKVHTFGFDTVELEVDGDVVSLVIYAPEAGPSAVLVLGDSALCSSLSSGSALTQCAAELGGGSTASCVVNQPMSSGSAVTLQFPDTDSLVAPGGDLVGRAGPAKVLVADIGPSGAYDLPCGVASMTCAECLANPGSCPDAAQLRACVDTLYESDGTCGTGASQTHGLFSSFAALPSQNFFRDMCQVTPEAPACTAAEPDLRAAVDRDGNLLFPMNYQDIELPEALPVPRFLKLRIGTEGFAGSGSPAAIPSDAFFASFTTKGKLLPPFFSRISEPIAPTEPAFLGTVDAERGVIRFLRRSPRFMECRDGSNDPLVPGVPCIDDAGCPASSTCGGSVCYAGGVATSKACNSDAQCGGGEECGPSIFDFSTRLAAGGAGPALFPGSEYEAQALNPVPLDCLEVGDGFLVACRSEVAEGTQINGDGDMLDDTVLTVRDSASGDEVLFDGGTDSGVAVARVTNQSFSDPIVAVVGDVFAFVAPETANGGIDVNLDGDTEDSQLQIFRFDPQLPGGPLSEITPEVITVDAGPEIDERGLIVSDDLLFFRRSEPADTPQVRTTMSLTSGGALSTGATGPVLTTDGRFAGMITQAKLVPSDTDSQADLYLRDRDTDQNGIFDEVAGTSIERVHLSSVGGNPNDRVICCNYSISNDGRYATFESFATDLVSPGGAFRVYQYDRLTGTTTAVFPTVPGLHFNGLGPSVSMGTASGDGRYVGVATGAFNITGDTASTVHAYVVDLDVDENGVHGDTPPFLLRASEIAAPPVLANGDSGAPHISNDGKWLVFGSAASNLDPAGDTNATSDLFVTELRPQGSDLPPPVRVTKTTELFSASEDLNAGAGGLAGISTDGRFIAFSSFSTNVPGAERDGSKWFVLDRDADEDGVYAVPGPLTNADGVRTELKTIVPASDMIFDLKLSPDGRYAVESAGQRPFGMNDGFTDFYLHDLATGEVHPVLEQLPVGSDQTTLSERAIHRSRSRVLGGFVQGEVVGVDTADLSADHSGDGDVDDLVLSVIDLQQGPLAVQTIRGASTVRTANGHALFLVPERFEAGGTDLNADNDVDDEIVFLWRNRQVGPAVNLGISARTIALSGTKIAISVSEEDEGLDLNGDLDLDDRVLLLNDVATATANTWVNTGQVATAISVEGTSVVYLSDVTANTASGTFSALKRWEAGTPTTLDVDVADFASSPTFIAYRKNENGADLNLNGGVSDNIMQAYDLVSDVALSSEQAAIRCPYEACDPSSPYRIQGESIVFLTREEDQGGAAIGVGCSSTGTPGECDLDGDGGATGIVLASFDVGAVRAGRSIAEARRNLPTTTGGICTTTATACTADGECGVGQCFVPPGGCVRGPLAACNPSVSDPCVAVDQYCQPVLGAPGTGFCYERQNACESDAQCTAPAFCIDQDQAGQQLADPTASAKEGGLAYVSRGICRNGSGTSDDTCLTNAECAMGFTCEKEAISVASADADGDGIADVSDNCDRRANADQADLDGDGIGDACDRATCGNGLQEYTEECDHGDQSGLDGVCSSECAYVGAATACSDGIDNDGDGLVDYPDDLGCENATDPSERSAVLACDDGVDNDGDYGVDVGGDIGCGSASWPREDPACSDGLDNDADGFVDFDGGLHAQGQVLSAPDPNCTSASVNREKPKGCGLGAELALVLLVWAGVRRRRGRS